MNYNVSLTVMIRQLQGLLGKNGTSDFENSFISNVQKFEKNTTQLSDKQVDIIDQLYKKHFG